MSVTFTTMSGFFSDFTILPRQGEVAPKVTKGEDAEQRFPLPPPPTGTRQPPPPGGGG